MKKIYLSLLVVSFLFGSLSAQKQAHLPLKSKHFSFKKANEKERIIKGTKGVEATLNETFNTFPPAGWTADPATGFWEGSSTWYYSQYAPNFGDGHFAVMDCFNIPAGEEGSLITPVLHPDATNHTLSYDVIEILLNDDYIDSGMELYIEFSTDNGSTWTTSTTNVLTNIPGHNTANAPQTPTTLTTDLSTYIGQAVKVRFRCVSDYGAFSLFLDNVTGPEADITLPTNDIELSEVYGDFSGTSSYAVIPLSQAISYDIVGIVSNNGTADQTNVTLHVDDADNSLAGTASMASLASGDEDTLTYSITLDNTTPASYGIKTYVTQTETDENPANNVGDSIYFSTDYSLYLRTENLTSLLTPYSFGTSAPATTGMEYGANYLFFNDDQVDSIVVFIYDAYGTGTITGKLYDIDLQSGNRTLVAQTSAYTPSGIPEFKTLALTTPYQVTGPAFLTSTVQMTFSPAAHDTIYIGADGHFAGDASVAGAAYLKVNNTWGWYYITGTCPMVGVITHQQTTYANSLLSSKNVVLYPNPVSETLYVVNEKAVDVEIYNINGQLVAKYNNQNVINVADLAQGTYMVKVVTNNNVITQKINIVR
ncbi:MAG: T9SS type A sorting domain-containing protein [Bacteroidales bacterium]